MSNDLTPLFPTGGPPEISRAPDASAGPPEPTPGVEPVSPPGPVWERYVTALLRRKWIILLITVAGTGAGVFATRMVHLKYMAQSTVWMETTSQSEADRGPIRDGQLLQSRAWLELLTSFTVLDSVVLEQHLYVLPEVPADAPVFQGLGLEQRFRPGSYTLRVDGTGKTWALLSGDVEIQHGRVGEPVGRGVGLIWTPPAQALRPGRSISFTIKDPHQIAQALGHELKTTMADQGNFLMLSLEGTDPKRIATTVNAVSDRYVKVAAQLKRAKLDELTGILDEQLRYAEKGLNDAEIALESFRIQTVTLPTEQASPVAGGLTMTRDPVFANFFDLKVKREQLREDREALERILREAEGSGSALDALAGVAAVSSGGELKQALDQRTAKRAALRTLQARYTDQYAPARQLAAELDVLEKQTIPALARSQIAELASQEAEAESRIGSASGELREIPPRAIEEARLQRQVAITENLHTTLKNRYEVARLAAAGSVPDIRILDRAVEPSAPVGDQRPLIVLGGLLGSFGLAVFGVLLLDRIDPRVRYPEQVTRDMGLPIIGMVPHLQNSAGAAGELNASNVSEAFREIRLSLLHAYGSAGPVLFTVTSAEIGDGKSFVSANLALAFSQQGYRTLLIDADIRRGRLHHLLDCRRSPGLTDFLADTATQTDIIQHTKYANVSVVGSGTRMEIGPELLGSSTMSQFIRSMRSQYDVIVMDSPPLGAGVDPYVLGTVTGNILLVVRTGNTSRSFANAKLSLLDRLPVRILGAILNDVPSHQKAYRYYSYLPGYSAEDEPSTAVVVDTGKADDTPPSAARALGSEGDGARLGIFR